MIVFYQLVSSCFLLLQETVVAVQLMLTQLPASKSNSRLSKPENDSIIVGREAKKEVQDLTPSCKDALHCLDNEKAHYKA